MDSFNHFKNKVYKINEAEFSDFALKLFYFQADRNRIYQSYLGHLGIKPGSINRIEDIPFLPIQFFKNHIVKTNDWQTAKIFKSSGTTKNGRSEHHVEDLEFYHLGSKTVAEMYFGHLSNYEICALLPSYQERGDSSLIEMVNFFSKHSLVKDSNYFQNEKGLIEHLDNSKNAILIFGVSHALLDLAEKIENVNWSKHVFVETGGMKGRKKEITRSELHQILNQAFGTNQIHTEYGMTELMSQAYGKDGMLKFPVWCKPLLRDLNDPFTISDEGSGGLNIVDLANIHSCAFIETGDLAKLQRNGSFEVLGRLDNSDIRGCSLLI